MKNIAALISRGLVLVLALSFPARDGLTQSPKAPQSVAIFLYNNVELLDFAGPGEVFTAAGYNVFTMSVDGSEIVSQGFVTVKPKYSLKNAPTPDIIVFPGGGAGPVAKDPAVMDWIKKMDQSGSFFMSVCTGAEILGRAEMLKGLNVTTWHGFIPTLQEILPDSHVLSDTRFVDNGNLITTAGVSAGIDGALHLVSRLKGIDVAKEAAYYMEYDKWNPDYGRVDKPNQYIVQLKAEAERVANSAGPEKKMVVASAQPQNGPVPYEGELKNLSFEFRDKGLFKQAAFVLEAAVKFYPSSGGLFTELSNVYKKLGKAVPVDEKDILQLLGEKKVEEAATLLAKSQKDFPSWKIYTEEKVLSVAYHFIHMKEYVTAIKIMQLNVKYNPDSWNAFDSLGEAYFNAGNHSDAEANLKKSLTMNPGNENAKKLLDKIAGL